MENKSSKIQRLDRKDHEKINQWAILAKAGLAAGSLALLYGIAYKNGYKNGHENGYNKANVLAAHVATAGVMTTLKKHYPNINRDEFDKNCANELELMFNKFFKK